MGIVKTKVTAVPGGKYGMPGCNLCGKELKTGDYCYTNDTNYTAHSSCHEEEENAGMR